MYWFTPMSECQSVISCSFHTKHRQIKRIKPTGKHTYIIVSYLMWYICTYALQSHGSYNCKHPVHLYYCLNKSMLFNSNSKCSTSNFWWCCKTLSVSFILKRALVADHVSVFYRSANGHRLCNGDHFCSNGSLIL